MGATLEFQRPVGGCAYTTQVRLETGEEAGADAHAETREFLRAAHPGHAEFEAGIL